MRKEPIIAIVLGCVIGAGVAFGLWQLSKANKNRPKPIPTTVAEQQELKTAITNDFAIVSPQNFAAISDESTTIKGLSNSGSLILASTKNGNSLTKTGNSGEFELQIKLGNGINKTALWSIEKDKEPEKTEVTLIYSKNIRGDAPLTSISGTVTDITADNLQIRTTSGEIRQLAITSDTSYEKILDSSSNISFSDVAIGDYIFALGTRENNIVQSERVIVTTEPDDLATVAVAGNIETLSSKDFIISSFIKNERISVDATGGVTVYSARDGIERVRLNSSSSGDPIVVLGKFKNNELVAEMIVLL